MRKAHRPRALLLFGLSLLAASPGAGAAQEAAGRTRPVVVGADPAYPPYEFLDPEGRPAGFNVDLTRAIAAVMGMEVEFRFGSWAEMRAGLERGDVDVLEGLSFSTARAEELDFAPAHAIIQHAIFARRGAPKVDGLLELAGKEVIVFRGGIMDELLTAEGKASRIIRTDTPADALRLLSSGQGEYVALALLPGLHILREAGITNVEPVARRVASERYGYAVRKGNQELLSRLEEGLSILKQSGRYQEIQARWLGVLEPEGPPWRTIVKWGTALLAPLVLGLGATVLWSRSLRRQVAQRTASLAREAFEKRQALEELERQRRQLERADKMAGLGLLVSEVAHEVNNPTGLMLLNLATLESAFLDARELLDERGASDSDAPARRDPLRADARGDPAPHRGGDRGRPAHPQVRCGAQGLRPGGGAGEAGAGRPERGGAHRGAAHGGNAAAGNPTLRAGARQRFPPLRGSAQRLEQVVVNLLVNACQALGDRERAIRLSTLEDREKREAILRVEDEGAGIPQEHLPRLFDPFFTTKRETGGTGLGLAICARIAREHQGRLEFESEVGRGTRASLHLPLPEATP